jgi:hypothetical protein
MLFCQQCEAAGRDRAFTSAMNACRPFSPPAWSDRRRSAGAQRGDVQHMAVQTVLYTADLPSRRSRHCALGSGPASPLMTAAPLHPCPDPVPGASVLEPLGLSQCDWAFSMLTVHFLHLVCKANLLGGHCRWSAQPCPAPLQRCGRKGCPPLCCGTRLHRRSRQLPVNMMGSLHHGDDLSASCTICTPSVVHTQQSVQQPAAIRLPLYDRLQTM